MGFGAGALETMGLTHVQSEFWRGRRVFVTGHTGFKGSWLTLWLQSLGAEVCGFALLPPTNPSLFEVARVGAGLHFVVGDVRSLAAVNAAMADFQPEVVMHLAAQSLVRASYHQPVDTYATNVMGTVHVLESARRVASVRCVVNVTTDKCYDNRDWVWPYREDEPMGGHDPYSSSKGCAELVTAAYRASFMREGGVALATARAGNVIGGGDWATDRLVPDVLRAFDAGEPVQLRHPAAVRPWQHVLEPLSGYLHLAQCLWEQGDSVAEGWNFGPQADDARPVQWIVEQLARRWGAGARWQVADGIHPHEAHALKLDISKAQCRLGWRPRWDLAMALEHTLRWHQAWRSGQDMRAFCLHQIAQYIHEPEELMP